MMFRRLFFKQLSTAERRRLMGGLVDIFEYFEGKTWAIVVGVIIMVILVIILLFPFCQHN